MRHVHLFQHTGGGCSLGCESDPCDDSYRCECGAGFTTKSSVDVHFTMPEFIAGRLLPEPTVGGNNEVTSSLPTVQE